MRLRRDEQGKMDDCKLQLLKTCNRLKSESSDNQSKGHCRNSNLAQEIAFDLQLCRLRRQTKI
jgi:hypothetical protein